MFLHVPRPHVYGDEHHRRRRDVHCALQDLQICRWDSAARGPCVGGRVSVNLVE